MSYHLENRWFIGLSCAVLNALLSSVGFTLQRKAQLLEEEESSRRATEDIGGLEEGQATRQAAEFRARVFRVVGISLYILAAAPDVAAYALAPQMLCVIVGCFRLVLVAVIAHIFLGEHAGRNEVLGMIMCSVGTSICLVFGPRPNEATRPVGVAEVCDPEVMTYLLVVLLVLLFLIFLIHSTEIAGCTLPTPLLYSVLPLATGFAYGVEKVFNTEIGFMKPPHDFPSGFMENPQWTPWMTMVASIAVLGLTDFYLNIQGAKRMPVSIFVPTTFAFGCALQFFQAMVIFKEFKGMDTVSIILSIVGALAALFGALCIQPPRCAGGVGVPPHKGDAKNIDQKDGKYMELSQLSQQLSSRTQPSEATA